LPCIHNQAIFGALGNLNLFLMNNRLTQFSLPVLFCFLSFNLFAQNILFFDDFSDGNIDDWTVYSGTTDLWNVDQSSAAGGSAPELVFSVFNTNIGESRLVSPIINTSGYTTLYLSFPQYFYPLSSPGAIISVETTSDGGATWNTVWQLNGGDLTDAYTAFEVITLTEDVGTDNFQFSMKYESAQSTLFVNWFIDDIKISDVPILFDALPVNILGTSSPFYDGDEVNLSCTVTSYGAESSSFDVLLEIVDENNSVVFSSNKSVENLNFEEENTINFDPWVSTEGNFTAVVTTLLADDENTGNDQISSDFTVFNLSEYCIPTGDCSGSRIDAFEFAGISNINSGCGTNGYSDFTNLQATAEIGAYYPISITSNSGQLMTTSIWIDLDQNFQFNDNELIMTDVQIPSFSTLMEEVQIPWTAEPVSTRMRVCSQFFYSTAENPCVLTSSGECEDYSITLTGGALAIDASAISIDMYQAYEQGSLIPTATVSNFGFETANFPVTISIDNVYTSTKNVANLGLGEEIQIEFDPWDAVPNEYTISVSTNLEDDLDDTNDQLSQIISIAEAAPFKMILGEEGTGTWCGYCPRGAVYMDSMYMKYPDNWVGVAVHNGDPMVNPEYDINIQSFISGYPGGVINRTIGSINPTDFEINYQKAFEYIALADIKIEDKTFDEDTKELTFTLTSNFVSTVSDFRFSAILIEDEVTGTGSDWDQANYYSGGGLGPMGGFEDLPDPVPAEDMVYNHVGRLILGGFDGVEGSLPAIVNYGESYSFEFSTIIDNESWDVNNMKVIGALINHATGEVINSTIEDLVPDVTNVSTLESTSKIKLYPNPAMDIVSVSNISNNCLIQLYNSNGQLMMEEHNVSEQVIFDVSNFIKGIYFIKVISNDDLITEKFEIIR
jgi:thiol-disulfide isomerase/thioredoxin